MPFSKNVMRQCETSEFPEVMYLILVDSSFQKIVIDEEPTTLFSTKKIEKIKIKLISLFLIRYENKWYCNMYQVPVFLTLLMKLNLSFV